DVERHRRRYQKVGRRHHAPGDAEVHPDAQPIRKMESRLNAQPEDVRIEIAERRDGRSSAERAPIDFDGLRGTRVVRAHPKKPKEWHLYVRTVGESEIVPHAVTALRRLRSEADVGTELDVGFPRRRKGPLPRHEHVGVRRTAGADERRHERATYP